jgi:hypothetical protein
MKRTILPSPWVLALLLSTLALSRPLLAQSADPGWPRVFKQDKKQLTVYQPQVDYWNGNTNIHFRCAIAVKGVTKQEKFGVAEMDAVTVTDHAARIVALVPTQRDLRFPNCSDSELAALRRAVDELKPPGQAMTISLDRVLAYLDPAQHSTQPPVEVNLDPPTIFYSRRPAILVMFMGEPQFKPVETNRTDVLFALNTNWDVLYDAATQRYYLLNGDNWLVASDVKGPWTPATSLPTSFWTLPASENWAEVRAHLPGQKAKVTATVFVTTQPAELIVTEGDPKYRSIQGTSLRHVANTDAIVFRNSSDAKFYFLVAGRWFRAASLEGPWSAASRDLPADFARIPDHDPAAFVKASVPGTREAKDAVLLASIPSTTTVNHTTNVTVNVTYAGAPQFVTIPSTTVQYAVNTPNQVFLVSGGYYWCYGGVWYCGASATGPWSFCTSVPAAIYTIPPSNPNYNVTYVTVQSTTPTTVVYSQTSGYSGEYVAATGVLMFGMGMLVGAAIADDYHDHYYYPPPCHYSYGCGAVYHYGGGGYYASAHVYGPYGGAGRTASYNPYTGTYARSSYAYGPYGSAARGTAYNPYTGTSAAGRAVSTPYGSARQGAAYNPYTGARAAGGQVNTAYGSAGRGAAYNPSTGQGAAGRYASGAYGSAGAIRTTEGSGMAAWDTQYGQGAVGKTQSGDVYAAKDGTVYKKDADGGWSQNSGSGWESTSKPQSSSYSSSTTSSRSAQTSSTSQQRTAPQSTSTASSTWSQNRSSMESQAQARQYGNQQAAKTSQYRSSSSRSRSSASSYSSGGRSRGGRR